ncbi:MAG: FtsQ-type POTRA domain-containing protein [Clostridium sp.]|nr:FtsQ-type POTRA domain-containing protein [Clostridium sp.]CCZ18240.1 cell division protein ftsQ [Clostridium sp. CAG:780]
MNKKPKKTTKNLYDFDYESKKEKKIKKKKADKKSASKAEQSGQAEKKKKYEDEIIIGVTRLPDKKDIHNKKEKKAKTTIIPKKIIPKSKKTKEIKNTKPNNAKPKSKKIKVLIISILVLIAIIAAMLSPLFNIKNIQVVGNTILSSEEIISISGIKTEENMFKVMKLKTIDRIKENAYINEVAIHKKLPNTIEIQVKERKPSFMLEYGNGYVYLSNQGYMLEISSIKKDIPTILGTTTSKENYKPGNRLNKDDLEKLGTVIKIMAVAKTHNIENLITTIDISNSDNYTLRLEQEKKTVYLGDCSYLETRMSSLMSILENEKDIEGEIFINMNINTRKPYFRESI